MKYETKLCKIFYLPANTTANKVDFYNVTISLNPWDGKEDAEDERIFYYMDEGEKLEIGMILGDGFVVTHIDGENE